MPTKIKLGLNTLDATGKAKLLRSVINQMKQLQAFSTPDVAYADAAALADTLDGAVAATAAARTALHTSANREHTVEKSVDDTIRLLARFVERIAKGDEAVLKSTGFDVALPRGTNVPAGLSAPVGVVVGWGDHPGALVVSWTPFGLAAHAALVQRNLTADNTSWDVGVVVTKSRANLEGLTSGGKARVRVAMLGGDGAGPWSSVIEHPVP